MQSEIPFDNPGIPAIALHDPADLDQFGLLVPERTVIRGLEMLLETEVCEQ